MSHFSVMVITETPEQLDAALAPFHEFECTGTDDEFVQDIDRTEEMTKAWREGTCSRLRAPDGTLHYPYGDEFYRDPTPEETASIGPMAGSGGNGTISWTSKDWEDGRGYRTKVRFVPEGWEEAEVPNTQVMSLADYAEDHGGYKAVPFGLKPDLNKEHKYGYVLLAEDGSVSKIVDRTNPNKQWDWWVIGGRWSGMLRAKPGAKGLLREKPRPIFDDGVVLTKAHHFDQMRKGDIDLERMRSDAEKEARAKWRETRRITGGASWDSWDDTRIRYPNNVERARAEYWEQPAIVQLKAAGRSGFFGMDDDLALDEDIYAERKRNGAVCTFAYLKDGQWAQRGQMGWWGISTDEMSQAQWQAHFNDMVDGLPDDALVTIVDCHI